MTGFTPFRIYEDFQPSTSLLKEEKTDTLVLNLPGYRKEQVKVQIDTGGTLKISGERPLPGNKWSRFKKDHRTPPYCITNQIRANFENGVLRVMMPKTVTTTQAAPKPPSPPSQKPPTTESSKISPPPVVAPPSQKTATTESSKISPPPVEVAPPSQQPATESKSSLPPSIKPVVESIDSKFSPPPVSSTSKKPVIESKFTPPPPPVPQPSGKPATKPIVPTPERQGQPSRPSQISEAPTTEGLPRKAKPSVGDQMEERTDKGRRQDDEITRMTTTDHDQEEKKSLTDAGKASYSGDGGGGDGAGSSRKTRMDEYKNKIEGFVMELKEKSSSSNKSELLVNVAVASLVVVALGVYATWNLKSTPEN